MVRFSLAALMMLSLSACHVTIGSAPPSSSRPSSKAPRASRPASAPAAPRERSASKAPQQNAAKRTTTSKAPAKKEGTAKRTNPHKTTAKRANPKGKKAVRTNPGQAAPKRTNPKGKARANPKKKKGKRTTPKGKRTTPKGKPQIRTNPTPKTQAGVHVSCNFEDGWVAVLPADVFDPGEEFLMQALIGLQGDPDFWGGLTEFQKYEPYKAQKCGEQAVTFDLAPGQYFVAVGMANQFFVRGEYRDNGYLEEISIGTGEGRDVVLSADELTHTWLCISCPFLVVFQDGKEHEVGQVLKDRYTRRRYGTDIVQTRADVRSGVLTLRLDEREPETSYIDGVVVRIDGQPLRLVDESPRGVRALDDETTALTFGESAVLQYDAGHLEDGLVDVQIEVSGHYEAIGPLL